MDPYLLPLYWSIAGLAFGSFISAVSYRLVHGGDWVTGRSRCPKCEHTLHVRDLLPLFSWLFLRGKCGYCRSPIHWRYPALELCCGAFFAFAAMSAGPSLALIGLSAAIVLGLIICVTDLDSMLVPLIPIGLLWLLGLIDSAITDRNLWHALFASASWFGGAKLLQITYLKLRKRDGLGDGDIYIMTACGSWLELNYVPLFLFFAGIIGTITALILGRMGNARFPFAPSLVAAWLCCTLVQPYIQDPIFYMAEWLIR